MSTITVLGEQAAQAEGMVEDGRVLVDAGSLEAATGWHLEERGLCRGDACVPVRTRDAVVSGERVDLAGVAGVLDAPFVTDPERSVVAIGRPAFERRQVIAGREATSVRLPDLSGDLHELSEWSRRRRLLVAFSSW